MSIEILSHDHRIFDHVVFVVVDGQGNPLGLPKWPDTAVKLYSRRPVILFG